MNVSVRAYPEDLFMFIIVSWVSLKTPQTGSESMDNVVWGRNKHGSDTIWKINYFPVYWIIRKK